MHPKVKAIFAENKDPQHCCRKRTFAATKPLGAFALSITRQVAEYRARIVEAETDGDLHDDMRGKLEYMMQPLMALERMASDLTRLSREITAAIVQVDRVFAESEDILKEHPNNGATTGQ